MEAIICIIGFAIFELIIATKGDTSVLGVSLLILGIVMLFSNPIVFVVSLAILLLLFIFLPKRSLQDNIYCPTCGRMNSSKSLQCYHCRKSLLQVKNKQVVNVVGNKCNECDVIYPSLYAYCPKCGTYILTNSIRIENKIATKI